MKIQIKIPDSIKTSDTKREQPLLNLPFFNTNICVASILQTCIDRTRTLRKKDNDSLFISIGSPHDPVCKETLSNWVKHVLENSKIDTSVLTAHSTRHASTSTLTRLS